MLHGYKSGHFFNFAAFENKEWAQFVTAGQCFDFLVDCYERTPMTKVATIIFTKAPKHIDDSVSNGVAIFFSEA